MKNPAPIALFVYKRPRHTLQTLEALMANYGAEQSHLYIFSDGPRHGADAETLENIHAVRSVIRRKQWCRSVTIIESDINKGLSGSIISGTTELVETFGKVIVIEDDLVTSPYFLSYMNDALDRYAESEKVMQISGYQFPIRITGACDALFLPLTTSWGWAVWQRSWKYFDPEAKGYKMLLSDATRKERFNLDGAYDYAQMLTMQMQGKVDSWAIRWYLTVFLRDGLVLYPQKSLVTNIGFDNSGENCSISSFFNGTACDAGIKTFPKHICHDEKIFSEIKNYIRKGMAH